MQVKAWTTPQDQDHKHSGPLNSEIDRGFREPNGKRGESLAEAVDRKNWPTPNNLTGGPEKRDSRALRGSGGEDLDAAVDNWATPRTEDQLPNQVAFSQDEAKRKSESLNPDWEEILMGWEIGWTDPVNVCAGIFPGFPMGQGNQQFEYEPPRTLPREQMKHRTGRIKACGNGVVPQCAAAAYTRLLSLLLQP